jgi:hypothetical protein
MPDAHPDLLAKAAVEVCPHARAAAQRLRRALARGQPHGKALEDLRAYLILARPGLPAVLAQEQAAATAAAIGHPPLPLPAEATRLRSDDIEPAA